MLISKYTITYLRWINNKWCDICAKVILNNFLVLGVWRIKCVENNFVQKSKSEILSFTLFIKVKKEDILMKSLEKNRERKNCCRIKRMMAWEEVIAISLLIASIFLYVKGNISAEKIIKVWIYYFKFMKSMNEFFGSKYQKKSRYYF